MTSFILVTVIASLLAAFGLVLPHILSEDPSGEVHEEGLGQAAREQERLLQEISELELDFKTGKVGQDDYEHQRKELLVELYERSHQS